jgi:pimeloyl-ACP methyl ester carboxylesterase
VKLSVEGQEAFIYSGGRAFEPSHPVLVFLHGAGAEHSAFALQSRYFAHHGYGVLAPDLPGHGRSQGPPLAKVAELTRWVVRLLDAAQVSSAALIGHSMGSLVALETAARYAARISGIALIGVAVPMPVADPLLDAARIDDPMAIDMLNIWGHSSGSRLGGHPIPGVWMLGEYERTLARSRPGVLHTDFKACHDYAAGIESARQVQCPALLILGSHDAMTPPRAAQELTGALRQARSVLVAGSGHALMAEQPDAVLDALREFLQDVFGHGR